MKKRGVMVGGIVVLAAVLYFIVSGLGEKERPGAIDDQAIRQLVSQYSASTIHSESASITSEQLIVTTKDGDKVYYDLPKDEFFVSIAPYMETTHPCAIHSLTGCRGELAGKPFDVRIEDEAGNVVIEEPMSSLSNGFIDLWLPRDQKYRITIEYDGRTAESELSTYKDDHTCITTMKLI